MPAGSARARKFRRWTGRDIHELVRLFTISAADFLDEWFEDERVKGAMATQAIIGAWCGPMTPGSAYVLVHHWIGEMDGHFGAWGWVTGGMGGLSGDGRAAARAAGAEIRTDVPVAQGRRRGAAVPSASSWRTGRSSGPSRSSPTRTRSRRTSTWSGETQLPDDVVRDIERYRTRAGSVKVNVALVVAAGVPPGTRRASLHKGLVAISPSVEYLERAWDDAKYGRPAQHPYVEVVFPTAHQPRGSRRTGST